MSGWLCLLASKNSDGRADSPGSQFEMSRANAGLPSVSPSRIGDSEESLKQSQSGGSHASFADCPIRIGILPRQTGKTRAPCRLSASRSQSEFSRSAAPRSSPVPQKVTFSVYRKKSFLFWRNRYCDLLPAGGLKIRSAHVPDRSAPVLECRCIPALCNFFCSHYDFRVRFRLLAT